MEKIDEQLYSLSLVEVPKGLHQSIMGIAKYKKIRPILFAVLGLFIFNFIITVWQIDVKLISADFFDMVQDFFDVFSFNGAFINTILGNFFQIVSPLFIFSAVCSLVGALYIGIKIRTYTFRQLF